jgi:hypothetical protein
MHKKVHLVGLQIEHIFKEFACEVPAPVLPISLVLYGSEARNFSAALPPR